MLTRMQQPRAPELQLLLACARAHPSAENEQTIRQLLEQDVDWARFARKALGHGLAGLAGHTLGRLVPDMVPTDILDAFATLIEQTRDSNQLLLNELSRVVEGLGDAGVEAIAFKGPVLAMQAFGDLGLRGFRDLDILIHDRDVPKTIETLCACGYERNGHLTPAQFNLIHRLQGQEIMFKPHVAAVEPHTRLTPLKMALDIDYGGLWRRARRESIFGQTMLTLSPEDTFVVLAIHGGKELWWDIKWACDVADFLASHPQLDWSAIVQRARAQGCYRMLLVATLLAHGYLGAKVPASIAAAEARDPIVEQIAQRILARWEMDDPGGPPSNKTLSMDRLRLHDGVFRQAGYVVRTLFLPGPQHVALVALPRALNFAYVPIGIAHDVIALPLYRAYRFVLAQADHVQGILVVSPLVAALAPISAKKRKKLRYLQQLRAQALRAVTANPGDDAAWIAMGNALTGLRRYKDAITAYDKALAIVPDHNQIWKKRSAVVGALRAARTPDLKDVPEFDAADANGWAIRAGFLLKQEQYLDASEASKCALHLDPNNQAAIRIGIKSRLYGCDWSQREADRVTATTSLKSGTIVVRPINLKQICDSEELSLSLAQLYAKSSPAAGTPLWQGERYRHPKIRLAYLSTDFRAHPVGATIVAPLEHHNKERFEVTAISLGRDDRSTIRKRIETAVDRFIDASTMSDMAVAKTMRALEIDIAIDLNGLTGYGRKGILVSRPAPIQVNYLGYPGTTAASHMDYIIADPTLIPAENQAFYSEKVAYLPNTYLPYDRAREIGENAPSRAEQGLPETGFIFACFNNLHKLGPEIFDVWMRLLRCVDGSVLWISGPSPAVMENLKREATARGVAPERLIFARFEKKPADHLARQTLADLFLDTLPYNAHSTACEALGAGLPLLTCLGRSFQARVAGSLLYAVGMPEMVTTSLIDYEKRALELARDPQQLAAIRQKLARNRDTQPLFDTAAFTRGLEAIYTVMWERQQAGLPPESFSVSAGK